MQVFDWEVLRPLLKESCTRDRTIQHAFYQWTNGNSYGDMSSSEMQSLFEVFRAGWIISESFVHGLSLKGLDHEQHS